jgi:hypothetical protein
MYNVCFRKIDILVCEGNSIRSKGRIPKHHATLITSHLECCLSLGSHNLDVANLLVRHVKFERIY